MPIKLGRCFLFSKDETGKAKIKRRDDPRLSVSAKIAKRKSKRVRVAKKANP